MIDVVNVTQHYGVRPVLQGINLRVNRGELVVVVGPNGMGKTTLLGVLGGALQPQEGHVAIDGRRRRSTMQDELAVRRTAVYLPDQPWLPGQRTGRQYLLGVGRLYGVSDDRLFRHVELLLGLFDLTGQSDQPIRSYSAGQKKKAALCGALVSEAPVLLLDEPFSGGLDPAGLLALKAVLRRHVERGGTVVLTSPVPEVVEEVADRVLILRGGEVVAFDTIDGLRRLTGVGGSLGQILERLLYPETAEKLARYFEGGSP